MSFLLRNQEKRSFSQAAWCLLLSVTLVFGLLPAGVSAQTAYAAPAEEPSKPAAASPLEETVEYFENVDESKLADEPLMVVYKDEPVALDQDLNVDTEALPEEVAEATPQAGASVAMEDVGVVSQQMVTDQLPDSGTVTTVTLDEDASLAQTAAVLEASDAVDHVSPNYKLELYDTKVDDPYANADVSSLNSQYYLGAVNAFKAWDLSRCEGKVTVAVVDSGVLANHAELTSIVDRENAYDATQDSDHLLDMTRDPVGHGTAVTGILAARANNAMGMAGVSYNAKIVPIRTFEENGEGNTAYVVKAYSYMLENYDKFDNLRVVNLSLGYYPDQAAIKAMEEGRDAMYNAIKALRDKHGVVTVAAGGNGVNGVPKTEVSFPSDYDICIGVAAVDKNMKEVKAFDYNEYKDVSAPGAGILHTGTSGNTAYAIGAGTSYASPIVAAAAALLCAYKPWITPDEVQEALVSTAVPVSGQREGNGSAGVIDMYAALESVSDYSVYLPSETFAYTGAPIKPAPEVKHAGKTLQANVDYQVTYENNTNAGTATVRIEGGSGDRAWSREKRFVIERASIKNLNIPDLPAQTFAGQPVQPKPQIAFNGKPLVEGTDYTLTYRDNDAAGTGRVTIVGKGNFKDAREITFPIVAASTTPDDGHSLANATVTGVNASYAYSYGPIYPVPVVRLNGTLLRNGVDYTVAYDNEVYPGIAALTISGKGLFRGNKVVTYQITPRPVSNASVWVNTTGVTYDGTAQRPAIVVTMDGRQMAYGTEYRLSWHNNVNAGTAVVSVIGCGYFTGVVSRSFTVSPKSLMGATASLSTANYTYDGSAKKPAVTLKLEGKTLKNGTDYTVSYKNNVNPGSATVTVTGKGNYRGTMSSNFNIAKISLAKASVSMTSTLPYSDKALKPAVTVKLGGKTLKNGTDYTVAYRNNVGSSKASTTSKATVTVTGKGNYRASVSKTFQIKNPSIQYYVHRQTYGWEAKYSKKDGQSSGTTGLGKRLEGIYIRMANKPVSGGLQYRTHVQKIGWQGWRNEGQMSGTIGKGYRLEAIQLKLTGNMARNYDVYYRVHAQKFGWMGWAKNGAQAGTAGYAYRLESIQIKLVPKGGKAPGSQAGAFRQK